MADYSKLYDLDVNNITNQYKMIYNVIRYSERFVVYCHCSLLLLYNVTLINKGIIHYLQLSINNYLKSLE